MWLLCIHLHRGISIHLYCMFIRLTNHYIVSYRIEWPLPFHHSLLLLLFLNRTFNKLTMKCDFHGQNWILSFFIIIKFKKNGSIKSNRFCTILSITQCSMTCEYCLEFVSIHDNSERKIKTYKTFYWLFIRFLVRFLVFLVSILINLHGIFFCFPLYNELSFVSFGI